MDVLEEIVEEFESAWKSGNPPRLLEFLANYRVPNDVDRASLLHELVMTDLWHRWHQGDVKEDPHLPQRPTLSDYVAAFPELGSLASDLSSTLKTYVPDASVEINWLTEGGINVSLPQADVRLVEDGYASAVIRTGHGLQRAFILTMLQHLAAAQVDDAARGTEQETTDDGISEPEQTPGQPVVMPSLVLCIEEPELYQHPNRQPV